MPSWWAWIPLVAAGALANPGNALERIGTAFLFLLALAAEIELVK